MRHRSRISSCFVLCLLLLGLPGCSFWAVRRPDRSVAGGGDCSTSAVAPVVDGVLAASFIGLGAAGAATKSCSGTSNGTAFGFGPCFLDFSGVEQGAGVGLIALGVLEAAAATYGAVQVSACHQAKKVLETPGGHPVPAPAFRVGAHPDPWPLSGAQDSH
ncbi:MAG TPA: hypothetical protein VFI53_02395 [Myxococcaceae bacterium]|nr:hypothetical protein [Myxococcaceae bacterium]